MSHIIIIGKPPGGLRTTETLVEVGEVRWSPPHDLSPQDERRRVEKVERLLERVEATLMGAEE